MLHTYIPSSGLRADAMVRSLSRRRFLAGTGAACAAAVGGPSTATARSSGDANASTARQERADAPDVEALVDRLVGDSLDEHDVPGASVAVVADGEIALAKGYGVADRESGDAVDATTPFRLGSVSKPVVATALMRLVQRGDIDPDADVSQYLDDLPVDDAYDEPVTLRHLVTHQAGFESNNQGLWIEDPASLRPLESYLREGPRARVRPPGVAGSYSNYGYALAGAALAGVRDEAFHDAMDAELLGPAGMTRSSFRQPLPPDLADAHATGYGPFGAYRPDPLSVFMEKALADGG